MSRRLHVLVIEDSLDDAVLTIRTLKKEGYELVHERVEDEAGLREALARKTWDIVLSDWSMPQFSALSALAIVKEHEFDVPFLIVSGTIGEETAVEALHAGADDFLIKGKLGRLARAIERELSERAARAARRTAEAALRASERRFKTLWDSGLFGIAVVDAHGRVHEANDAFLGLIDRPRDALTASELRWSELSGTHTTPAELVTSKGIAKPWEKDYVRRDGVRVPALVAMAALEDAQYIAVSVDLSEQRRLEEQFRQAQKLEAIGSLASSVAHDFNNLLSVILSYATLIIDDLPESSAMREDVEEIKKAGERAVALTRQLLAFGRRQVLQPRALQLRDVLEGVERMLRRLLSENIELSLSFGQAPGVVHADPGQIEQIVMNLVVNARDAMPCGGELSISVENIEVDASQAVKNHGLKPGSYVALCVKDVGVGMDEATQARIFEPFFTTKEVGKGTGLGLSTVYGIVQQSGGHVMVTSRPGVGTTFSVLLPRIDDAPTSATARRDVLATLHGTETLLLVEDDDQVRSTLRAVLARQGYEVLDARSGAEAVITSQDYEGEIALLITDVVMPRMSGQALATRLEASRPSMKVLFLSGYTMEAPPSSEAGAFFLQKPVSPETLAQAVRTALDSQQRST